VERKDIKIQKNEKMEKICDTLGFHGIMNEEK
jgi:hypothetical protein